MPRSCFRLFAAAVVCGCLTSAASAQTWTGATSNAWGTSTNWTGTAPTNNASLAFTFGASGAGNLSNNNDLTGLTATSITFQNVTSPSGYTISGNSIALSGNITNTSGANTINLAMVLSNATHTVSVAQSTDSLTINGVLSGSGSSSALTKTGNGLLYLAATNNSYTGATTINGGTLQVNTLANGGSNSSIGAASSAITLNGGTLQYLGSGSTTNRSFDLGANGGTIDSSGTGAVVFTSISTIGHTNDTHTLTLSGSNTGNNSLAMIIDEQNGSHSTSVSKMGSGLWILNGASTYSGGTTVSAGTLLVNNTSGSGTGSGAVTVSSSATFGGTGSTDSAVTVNANGTIRGGGSGSPTGTLTGNGNVSIATNGILAFEANRTGAGTASASKVSLGGSSVLNLAAGGGAFTINLLDTGSTTPLVAGESYTLTLATVNTAGNIKVNGVSQGANATISSGNYTLTSSSFGGFTGVSLKIDATGKNLNLSFTPTPVPEPATVMGIAAGALGLGGVVRRVRRGKVLIANP